MSTGASTVFTGRDNSGEAAIVNSTQDTSFMTSMLSKISTEAIRQQEKREKDLAALKKAQQDALYAFDPTGDAAADAEQLEKIEAYEGWLADQYAADLDPSDPTTEAGKTALKMRRALDLNNIQGKTASATYKAALKAADAEGNDVGFTNEWLQGYRDVKPNEGESLAAARSRYTDEHPDYVKKATGLYDFITPIADKIEYDINTMGDKRLNTKKAAELIDMYLMTPEGQQKFKDMGGDVNDIEGFKNQQIKLLQGMMPTQMGKRSQSSSSSSSSGGNGSNYIATPTTSTDSGMLQGQGYNAIKLGNSTGGQLAGLEITDENGNVYQNSTLNSINKDKNGKLWAEFYWSPGEDKIKEANAINNENYGEYLKKEVREGRTPISSADWVRQYGIDVVSGAQKKFVPYEYVRDQVMQMYGRDVADMIGGGASSGAEGDKLFGNQQ